MQPLKLRALCFAFAASAFASDEDGAAIVERWLAAGSDVSTLRVEFTQTRKLKTIKLPIVQHGTLWIDYSNDRFRWQTGAPPQTIVVCANDELTIIRTPGKKFETRSLKGDADGRRVQGMEALAGGLPRTLEEFNQDYRLIETKRDGGIYRLTTRLLGSRGRGVDRFVFLIEAEQHRLQGFEMHLEDGSSISTGFDAVESDLPLAAYLFAPDLTDYRETRF